MNGITSKIEYLKDLGIDGVWLSPIFKVMRINGCQNQTIADIFTIIPQSPMKDFGYDISDFRQIQPEYGTMEDFDRMAEKFKQLGVRLILDFVPNHT